MPMCWADAVIAPDPDKGRPVQSALLLQLGLEARNLGLEEGGGLGGVLRGDELGLQLRHVGPELLHLLAAGSTLRRGRRAALQIGDPRSQALALALLLHVRGL